MDYFNSTLPLTGKVGWVNQVNQRGTFDIFWSCFLIIIASVWTVLHVNLPCDEEGYSRTMARKARWALFALFSPELICLTAGDQWSSAKISVENMHSLHVNHWTKVHGFFADSGGFVLCPPDLEPFPINSRALYYLVRKKYIEAPEISKDEIWDRSKNDHFAKWVALIQSGYMIVQCIARVDQGLEVSCLELATIAWVFCTAITYFFWMSKPLSVEKPILIEMTTEIKTVLIEAGNCAKEPYDDTPMDFVENPGWRCWRRRRRFTYFDLKHRPIKRIPDDYILQPQSMRMALFLWSVSVCFGSVHLSGWNLDFPTTIERWLWRSSSLIVTIIPATWGLVLISLVKPGIDFSMTMLVIWYTQSWSNKSWRQWALYGPASFFWFVYYLARAVLVVECFTSMRSMDSSTYRTVSWTDYTPHL